MASLYSNENFPLPVVEELRQLGHDVLTIQDAGQANRAMSDEDVLAFAHSQGRVLLTLNRKHFVRLQNEQKPHSGIIACTYDPDFRAWALRIHALIEQEPQITGRLLRVNRPPR